MATPARGPALPPRVGFGDGEVEGFEFSDEFVEPAVVAEPGLVVGELLVGQDADGGLAVFLASSLAVGPCNWGGSAWQRQFT